MDVQILQEIETLSPTGKRLTVQKVRDQVHEPTRADEQDVSEPREYYQVNDGGTISEVLLEDGIFKRKYKEGSQEKVEELRPVNE